jgi:hypothetical protein
MPAAHSTVAHEEDSVEDRGRLAPHDMKPLIDMVHMASRKEKRVREEEGDDTLSDQWEGSVRSKRVFMRAFMQHCASYDMASRPPEHFAEGRMTAPWAELTECDFKAQTRFCKDKFFECCDSLMLFPRKLVSSVDGCCASRELAMFCLLRRWAIPDTLTVQARSMRANRSWLGSIVNAAIEELMVHYRKLLTTFDFVRVKPHLDEWAEAVEASSPGGTPGVVNWADGKPWPMPKPGCGITAHKMAAALGVTLDAIQRTFFNNKYHAHGVKVHHRFLIFRTAV